MRIEVSNYQGFNIMFRRKRANNFNIPENGSRKLCTFSRVHSHDKKKDSGLIEDENLPVSTN